jgi:anti-sigma regulatory factor (Ser/Thr protein kinase)
MRPGGGTGTTPGGRVLSHAAFFYRDQAGYTAAIVAFARAGLANGEPVLVALPGEKAQVIRACLDGEPGVVCRDMAELGRNPARIIPEISAFTGQHPGQRTRFIGEPVWPGRSPAEICEAARHEALINLAFAGTPARILCPYDAARLAGSVLAGASRTHAEISGDGREPPAAGHAWPASLPPECDLPLGPPPAGAETLEYNTNLAAVRLLVREHARRAGLGEDRTVDLVLAANEIAANTISHTTEGGVMSVWHTPEEIICEVHDQGWITDPLAGRVRHGPDERGHGLWLVNQVCDLVELRTGRSGTTVRMHIRR